MRSLVYVSSATVPFSSVDLLELLVIARERNRAQDVTGMLLYRNSSFIQVLEGEDDVVRATYARIARDPRHGGCLRLLDVPIETRQFAEWEMGFRNLSDQEVLSMPGYSSFLNSDFTDPGFCADPSRAMRLLNSFRRTND